MDLLWPSNEFDHFDELVSSAITRKCNVSIAPSSIITLNKSVVLKLNRKTIKISCFDHNCTEELKPIIQSYGHSIFQVEGRGTHLTLENITLKHTCYSTNHKDIGAGVFVLNTSYVIVSKCSITSLYGFGLWGVQNAVIDVRECTITSTIRSGVVAFGNTKLTINNSLITNCGIHNICSRGNTVVTLNNCTISNGAVRGIYSYHSVKLNLSDCLITGTKCPLHAAIEVWCTVPKPNNFIHPQQKSTSNSWKHKAARSASHLTSNGHNSDPPMSKSKPYIDGQGVKKHVYTPITLTMNSCTVNNNQGKGLLLRDHPEYIIIQTIENCIFENNKGGDVMHETHSNSTDISNAAVSESAVDIGQNSDPEIRGIMNTSTDTSIAPAAAVDAIPLTNATFTSTATSASGHDYRPDVVRWEFEVDDPHTLLPQSSTPSSSSWRQYSDNDSHMIEALYQQYVSQSTSSHSSSYPVEEEEGECVSHIHRITCTTTTTIRNKNNDDTVDSNTTSSSVIGNTDSSNSGSSSSSSDSTQSKVYDIDFASMTQTNVNTYYERCIRRVVVRKCGD